MDEDHGAGRCQGDVRIRRPPREARQKRGVGLQDGGAEVVQLLRHAPQEVRRPLHRAEFFVQVEDAAQEVPLQGEVLRGGEPRVSGADQHGPSPVPVQPCERPPRSPGALLPIPIHDVQRVPLRPPVKPEGDGTALEAVLHLPVHGHQGHPPPLKDGPGTEVRSSQRGERVKPFVEGRAAVGPQTALLPLHVEGHAVKGLKEPRLAPLEELRRITKTIRQDHVSSPPGTRPVYHKGGRRPSADDRGRAVAFAATRAFLQPLVASHPGVAAPDVQTGAKIIYNRDLSGARQLRAGDQLRQNREEDHGRHQR